MVTAADHTEFYHLNLLRTELVFSPKEIKEIGEATDVLIN